MLIYGGGRHSSVIIEIAKSLNIPIQLVFDDNEKIIDMNGIPVAKYLANTFNNEQIIMGIGDNRTRKKIIDIVKHEFRNLIHSSAIIASTAKIGTGNLIKYSAIIEDNAKIGDHCIINTACSLGHDCVIEDFVHLSPNCALGAVTVGEGTHIGMGTTVIPGVKIGKWVTIGGGSVIIRDVPDYAVVVGNPGRVIKINKKE